MKQNLTKILLSILLIVLSYIGISDYYTIDKLKQSIEIKEQEINKLIEIQETEGISVPYKKDLGIHELTFYTHTGNKTAIGKYPKASHTVAVDKNLIPLGSILYIEGYGIKVAEDTGGDIKGTRIDVFVDTKEQAIKLGRKQAKVYLLK